MSFFNLKGPCAIVSFLDQRKIKFRLQAFRSTASTVEWDKASQTLLRVCVFTGWVRQKALLQLRNNLTDTTFLYFFCYVQKQVFGSCVTRCLLRCLFQPVCPSQFKKWKRRVSAKLIGLWRQQTQLWNALESPLIEVLLCREKLRTNYYYFSF